MTDLPLPDRRALAEGRADAFAELYDRHAVRMLAVARAIAGSAADAEDAVHETFLDLYRSRGALASARDERAYLVRAVRNAALRVRDRRRDEPLERDPAAASSPDRDMELERALATLPAEQREVLALKLDAELTFEQIGAVLAIPANTASSRYRYALEKLRAALGGAR
ncbi:MAG: sigma-70 family RNA polymerase sigma factor [Planctomycetes bacterium]|nr:sigma-70 family RNA polymerase sigma factor [Planctomycetota bacterium]